MSFLDDIFRAVESGDLEKRLESVADKLEGISKNVTNRAKKLADAPGKVVDAAQPDKSNPDQAG